jgi:hypothetical protein
MPQVTQADQTTPAASAKIEMYLLLLMMLLYMLHELTYGRAARSKHSLMRLRSALASSMDLKNWQYSCTPCTPKVLFTLPTCRVHSSRTDEDT